METKQNVYGKKNVVFPKPEFYVVFTGGEGGNIIDQYEAFIKIYREQYRLYGRTQKAVLGTIRICKNRNVLREYLESREKEVVDIMMTLFNQEYALERYTEEIREEGRQDGEMKAKKETALALAGMGLPVEQIAEAEKVSVGLVKQWLDTGAVFAR